MGGFREGVGILGEALGLLGGVLSFLGATGIVLFILSLLLLAMVGAFSPLPKMINYFVIVALVTALALFGIEGFGELPGRIEAIRGYLVIMLAPVIGIYLIRGLFGWLFRGRSETEQLKDAVTELTEQVAALRRDRTGELRGEAAFIDVEPEAPRLLRRLPKADR